MCAVLYSHFENKDAIVAAVAVEGFAELAQVLCDAIEVAEPRDAALEAVARAYLAFAIDQPALYDAMFTLASLPFGRPERPAALREGFAAIREAVAPVAGDRDPDVLTQLTWSALHGLATLTRGGRLGDGADGARLTMLVDLLTESAAAPRPRPRVKRVRHEG